MTLAEGTRLGSYDITGVIGAGGMGEVYRARDRKLNRDVAIKVLPELFAADPDRLARFEREAQTLAALNHPNIAQIHGVVEIPPQTVAQGFPPPRKATADPSTKLDALTPRIDSDGLPAADPGRKLCSRLASFVLPSRADCA